MYVRSFSLGAVPRLFILCCALFCVTSAVFGKSFKTVVIDAGHGGHDRGGSYGRVYEKHLALDTAFRLEKILKRKGFRTVMTRRSDRFVTLSRRAAVGNKYGNSIFVSIHYNYTWKKNISGLETFYYGSRSSPLAKQIQSKMLKRVRAGNRGAKFARYFVLRRAKNPAVLVEGGFVSNSRERARMKKGSFRQGIANGIADGIVAYQQGRRKGYYH